MIIKEIKNRRSIREYKSDSVSENDILEIIKAAQIAPSANGNHSLEIIIVKNQEMKNKIFGVVGQEFVKEAPVLIAPVTDVNKSDVPIQDIAVASENMFLQAKALGLGTVWKHIREEWAAKIKALLNIPENFLLINIIPIGYPKEIQAAHSEEEFDKNKIHNEKW